MEYWRCRLDEEVENAKMIDAALQAIYEEYEGEENELDAEEEKFLLKALVDSLK